MRRATFVTIAAFLALVMLASPAFARKPKRSPEQGTWKIRVTPDGDAAAKGEKQTEDTLMIEQGIFRSTTWDPYGFPPSPYTLEGTTFSVEPVSRRSRSTSSLMVVPTPTPMLKHSSAQSAFMPRTLARRMLSTPAMNVVATAPNPGVRIPSVPVAGAMLPVFVSFVNPAKS